LTTQDNEILDVLENMPSYGSEDSQQNVNNLMLSNESRIGGNFCSDTIFNLSHRVLSEYEIKVLEKGLDFAPIQNKINEPELMSDFQEFCRRMRIKWHFRNSQPQNVQGTQTFAPKSTWKPPIGHPNLEVFLEKTKEDLFKSIKKPLRYSNLCKEEWQAV